MIAKNLKWACIALTFELVAHSALAAPTLTVAPIGFNGANRLWAVDVAPDPALFSNNPPNGIGGSLAVELAFSVDSTDLVGVTRGSLTDWPDDNPGNNPFTNTVTNGLWVDLVGDDTFGAFGSAYFTTAAARRLLTIETLSSGLTSIRYGTSASANATKGNLIAQAGQTFRYTGTATIPEPASIVLFSAGIGAISLATARRRRRADIR